MLKFNIKEHELKELEKYGFKDFFGYEKFYNKSLTCSIGFNSENYLYMSINNSYAYDMLHDLYDLIKAGLIIKEEA